MLRQYYGIHGILFSLFFSLFFSQWQRAKYHTLHHFPFFFPPSFFGKRPQPSRNEETPLFNQPVRRSTFPSACRRGLFVSLPFISPPTKRLSYQSLLTFHPTLDFRRSDETLSPAVGRYPIAAKRGAEWATTTATVHASAAADEDKTKILPDLPKMNHIHVAPFCGGESSTSSSISAPLKRWHASSKGTLEPVVSSKPAGSTPAEAAAAAVAAAVAAVKSLARANAEVNEPPFFTAYI